MAAKNGSQSTRNDWAELTQSAPGTPMGTLLRSFWQPVAASSDIAPGKATSITTMNQDLTLYRGEGGEPHLVAQRCAHRGTELRVGWVEGDCIRCFYHGWKYDATGQCVEQPAEPKTFAHKVKIEGYPTKEYGGLIFAYLGEREAPPFPRRHEIEREGVSWVMNQVWPCNWFQQVENSIDASHVSFVHREGGFGQAVTEAPPTLEYEETEFGIIQRAIRPNNVRISDWQFPNCNHVVVPRGNDAQAGGWVDLFTWKVPVDDSHTRLLVIRSMAATSEAKRKLEEWAATRGNYDPSEHEDELFAKHMPDDQANLIAAQDYLAQVAQGAIADRSQERLGQADAGVILLRKSSGASWTPLRRGGPPSAGGSGSIPRTCRCRQASRKRLSRSRHRTGPRWAEPIPPGDSSLDAQNDKRAGLLGMTNERGQV